MQRLILIFLILLFFDCGSDVSKMWNFEWTYLNRSDSSHVFLELEPYVKIESDQFNPPAENISFSQDGVLRFRAYIVGSESYVNDFHNNANLHVQLFQNNSICFDTLYKWNELKFIKGKDAEGNKNQDINFQTFYISGLK
ncbi:MAG: hypothetical protein GX639_20170 [Fibrobacter sp.]|nr:hypothetical protein [Fibrobacter sp.]